jgi:DNA-directed RNA polymerase subunit RPC12/RpoP
MSDVIKFACSHCSQHIRAFPEHIGQSLRCPSCGTTITVPSSSQMEEEREEELVVVRKFTDDELNLIRREGSGAYEAYIGGAVRKYWQFTLLADLLAKRMQPLQRSVLDILRKQEQWDRDVVSHGQFVNFINDKTIEFFGILYQLCDRMVNDLDKVLYEDNLEQILVFANQMGTICQRLTAFHDSLFERPLPAESPYTELQGIMKGWAPFCWQHLNNVIDELKALGVRKQTDSSWKVLQMSFTPPTLHEFCYWRMNLPEAEPELFKDV